MCLFNLGFTLLIYDSTPNLVKMESYNCDLCGVINFKSRTNLTNHQKGIYCRAVNERIARPLRSRTSEKIVGPSTSGGHADV
jgi:hypothetical protein